MQKILQFLNKLGGVMAADYVLKNNKIKESKNVMPSDSDSIDNIASIKGSHLTSLNTFNKSYKLTSYLKTFQMNYHLQISFLNSHHIFALNSLYHIYKIFHLFHLH